VSQIKLMICKASSSILEQTTSTGYLLSQKDFSVVIHHSINDVSDHWEIAAPANNIFLQRTYLQLLEENPPSDTQFVYLLFYKKSKPIGVSIGQVGNFNADESINDQPKSKDQNQKGFASNLGSFVKSFVAKRVDIKALVFGNTLLSGEKHIMYFDDKEISKESQYKNLCEAVPFVQKELLTRKRIKISLFYLKEFHHGQRELTQEFLIKKNKYHEFTAQPNMVLDFREDWNSFDDYLAAMSSKYRVRVKRAYKKGSDIERKEFGVEEIEENLEKIYSLYEKIADKSVFNLVKLNPNYFVALKKIFGEDFKFTAYYLDGKMVAFFTAIKNYHELEAHFLGYEEGYNRSHQMYLNVLYDLVKIGFEMKCKCIVFARTALEIKSSVGAEPHQMYWYLRHRNNLTNRFLSQIVNVLNPEENWVQRKPFKDQN